MFKIEKLHPEDGDIIIIKVDKKYFSGGAHEAMMNAGNSIKKFLKKKGIEVEVIVGPMDYDIEVDPSGMSMEILTPNEFLEELKAL